MKKILSVLLAAIMAVSVFAVSVIPAVAAPSPTASTAIDSRPQLQVNGKLTKTDITYAVSEGENGAIAATFRYVGEGTLKSWEHNLAVLGFEEGEDYTAVQNKDGSFTITFISAEAKAAFGKDSVIVNAIVDIKDNNGKNTTSNGSSKSPETGIAAAAIAGSVALAGAGIAVLSAVRKKDAE